MSLRIIMNAFGSLGDVLPFLALGTELVRRGHDVVFAGAESERARAAKAGLSFRSAAPSWAPGQLELGLLARMEVSYADLTSAVETADVLISSPLSYAAPLVAARTGMKWVSVTLQPAAFLSAYDEPLLTCAPTRYAYGMEGLRPYLVDLWKRQTHSWSQPIRELRAALGLPPGRHPICEDIHSPDLILALFSEVIGRKQADWPRQVRVTGFSFCDDPGESQAPSSLDEFLAVGPAPVVFALGSDSEFDCQQFYENSVAAAIEVGCRALLIGLQMPEQRLLDGMMTLPYAPYSQVFTRAAAVVHHGGIGTTALALRAGKPMLVVPQSADQPDNAARVTRLGVACTLLRSEYTAANAARELRILLSQRRFAVAAGEAARRIRLENGVDTACRCIEQYACAMCSTHTRS